MVILIITTQATDLKTVWHACHLPVIHSLVNAEIKLTAVPSAKKAANFGWQNVLVQQWSS
jgi:hypothetical protein